MVVVVVVVVVVLLSKVMAKTMIMNMMVRMIHSQTNTDLSRLAFTLLEIQSTDQSVIA